MVDGLSGALPLKQHGYLAQALAQASYSDVKIKDFKSKINDIKTDRNFPDPTNQKNKVKQSNNPAKNGTVDFNINGGNLAGYTEYKVVKGKNTRGYTWAFNAKNKFGEEYSASGWIGFQGTFSTSNALPNTFVGKQMAEAKKSSERNSPFNTKDKANAASVNVKPKAPIITLYTQPKITLPPNDYAPYPNSNLGGLVTGNLPEQGLPKKSSKDVGSNPAKEAIGFITGLPGAIWEASKKTLPTDTISAVLGFMRPPHDLGAFKTKSNSLGIVASGHLTENVKKDGKVVSYTVSDQLIVKDGHIISKGQGEFLLKDNKGTLITDQKIARAQILVYLNSVQSQVKKDQFQTQLAMPYDPKKPNEFRTLRPGADNQAAKGSARTNFMYKIHSETSDQTCRANAMLVPNIVIQAPSVTKYNGKLTHQGEDFAAQPFTLFFPVTCPANKVPGLGSLPNATQTSYGGALIHSVQHNGGFYPNSPYFSKKYLENASDWSNFLSKIPFNPFNRDTKIKTVNTIVMRTNIFTDQNQTYVNVGNGSTIPTAIATGSVNDRIIAKREEHVFPLMEQEYVTPDGHRSTETTLAPYTWGQTHVSAGVGKKGASLKIGAQAEFGIYIQNYGTSVSTRLGMDKKPDTDWHIVNGKVVAGREAWAKQFSNIQNKTGIVFRGQSILPKEKDNNSPIFLRVPNLALNFGNKTPNIIRPVPVGKQQQTMKDLNSFKTVGKADKNPDSFFDFLSGKRPDAISADALVASFRELSKRFPEHVEFRSITAETLVKLNKRLMVEFIDPTTGEKANGFKLGDWINTGLSTSLAGPGLYTDPSNLPNANQTQK